MVFNTTLTIFQLYRGGQLEKTGENHRPALSHNVVSSIPRHERDSNSQFYSDNQQWLNNTI